MAQCEQTKCPRCTSKDLKIWSALDSFEYSSFGDGNVQEKEHYFQTILHLTHVLPLAANKSLIDIILMPLLQFFKSNINNDTDKG